MTMLVTIHLSCNGGLVPCMTATCRVYQVWYDILLSRIYNCSSSGHTAFSKIRPPRQCRFRPRHLPCVPRCILPGCCTHRQEQHVSRAHARRLFFRYPISTCQLESISTSSTTYMHPPCGVHRSARSYLYSFSANAISGIHGTRNSCLEMCCLRRFSQHRW